MRHFNLIDVYLIFFAFFGIGSILLAKYSLGFTFVTATFLAIFVLSHILINYNFYYDILKFQSVVKNAKKFHKGQKYGRHDYVFHLDEVFELTKEFKLPNIYSCLAYSHDLLEDTKCTYEDIVSFGGEELAYYSLCLKNKEDKEPNYNAMKEHKVVFILKLLDRIVNVKNTIKSKGYRKLTTKYITQHRFFLEAYNFHKKDEECRKIFGIYSKYLIDLSNKNKAINNE